MHKGELIFMFHLELLVCCCELICFLLSHFMAVTCQWSASLQSLWSSLDTWHKTKETGRSERAADKIRDLEKKRGNNSPKAGNFWQKDLEEDLGKWEWGRRSSCRDKTQKQTDADGRVEILLWHRHLSLLNSLQVQRGCMTEINQRAIVHTRPLMCQPIDTGKAEKIGIGRKRETGEKQCRKEYPDLLL